MQTSRTWPARSSVGTSHQKGAQHTPFTYCGKVDFAGWEGEAPITVLWKLRGGAHRRCALSSKFRTDPKQVEGMEFQTENRFAMEATEQPIDTNTAAGKAFLDMLGVFAEFETNLRRELQIKGIAKAIPTKYEPFMRQVWAHPRLPSASDRGF